MTSNINRESVPRVPHEDLGQVKIHAKFEPHSLTPWSTVLLEQLTVTQLVKKFLAFYGTRRFIAAFTNARYLSLS